jgi:hypothetical protein
MAGRVITAPVYRDLVRTALTKQGAAPMLTRRERDLVQDCWQDHVEAAKCAAEIIHLRRIRE